MESNNELVNFNGTSKLSYGTQTKSALTKYNLIDVQEFIIQNVKEYLNLMQIIYSSVEILEDWLIGYKQNQNQGLHDHGYVDNIISGAFYTSVPDNSGPITFISPNPYYQHVLFKSDNNQYQDSINYFPKKGRIVMFPSFIKHIVNSNTQILINEKRIAVSFNVAVHM